MVRSTPSLGGMYLRIHFTHQIQESQFNSLPISQIMKEGKVLAIILRRKFNQEGVHFLTPDDFSGSSVCVMQWTGVIRDETLIETDITAIFVNCLRSGAN
ncbi:hypothetical protein [Microcystis aeruginosa]|uniref:hypothetical protein n=2 Tax=Microcystaceae TaxID=1890449 RepID=UPI0009C05667|nr:hypothetical protein [Microcystis aeruginosa]